MWKYWLSATASLFWCDRVRFWQQPFTQNYPQTGECIGSLLIWCGPDRLTEKQSDYAVRPRVVDASKRRTAWVRDRPANVVEPCRTDCAVSSCSHFSFRSD